MVIVVNDENQYNELMVLLDILIQKEDKYGDVFDSILLKDIPEYPKNIAISNIRAFDEHGFLSYELLKDILINILKS